jgi:hypothetical protein
MGTYSRNVSITDQVLILDGLTGTGKTMFGPILGCLNGVQPGRFEYMVEYLSIVAESGHLEPEAAKSLIRTLIDVKTYDNSISREVNFRPKDLSSVLKHGDRVKIFIQLMQNDGTTAIKKLRDNPRVPFFITHQLYGCIDLLSKTYGDGLFIIEMVRHPFYLFDHWLSYLPYHGTSPHDFTLLLNVEGSEFPWFTHSFSEEYIDAKNEDRVALAIAHLLEPILGDLPNSSVSKQTLVIPFEQFVLNPHSFITKIEQHTGRKFSKRINKVLTKQHVPRESVLAGPNLNIYRRYGFDPKSSLASDRNSYLALENRILPLLSDSVKKRFKGVADAYEARFGLWF